ncbi:MAG TPA: ion channel [Candidatus Dormibacteraeota bacterium]
MVVGFDETVLVIARFGRFSGKYVLHCHNGPIQELSRADNAAGQAAQLRGWRGAVLGRDRYGVVLTLILGSIILTALTGDVGFGRRLAWTSLLAVSLIFTLWTSRAPAPVLIVTLALTVVSLGVSVGSGMLIPESMHRTANYGIATVLVSVTAVVVARRLVQHPTVNADTIAGAVCVYLLLGEFFAMMFGLLATLESGSFFRSTSNPTTLDYVYFSYSTLATVGYGDLVAATSLGRMLAVSEALMGQIYLVTVLALIVGHVGRPTRRRADLGERE